MSIAGLMTAVAELVADTMVNEAQVEAPDPMLRYHGGVLPAGWCLSDAGQLAVSWGDGRFSTQFPASAASQQNSTCSGRLVATLQVRWVRCWPVPDTDPESAVPIITDAFLASCDAVTTLMADVAELVGRALYRLECTTRPSGDDFVDAVLAQVAPQGWLRLVEVSPIVPSGGGAGVLWRLHAAALPVLAGAS